MKLYTTIKTLAIGCLVAISTMSCSKWLEVKMEDGILSNVLFADNDGYKIALNGIYTTMNEGYGQSQTMVHLDILAQYYDVKSNKDHAYKTIAEYNYNDANFESVNSALWTRQYSMIANINAMLYEIDAENSAISPRYYNTIKGEALALRAFLHFDLLRLYGPIMSEEGAPDIITIPYQDTDSKEIQPLLPAGQVLDKVIADLNAAANLLKDDPITTEGVLDSDPDNPNENNDFRYRQYRMNYYAVQTLLARAYLWKGDKTTAGQIARNLIEENREKQIFPWTAKADIQNTENPDLIFSSEVIFGIYNQQRINSYRTFFRKTASLNNALRFKGENFTDPTSKMPYFYTDDNDIRKVSSMWSIEVPDETSGTTAQDAKEVICFNKYLDFEANAKPSRYMIPLIRISEVYLIAAECAESVDEALLFLNELRNNRSCIDLAYNPDEDVNGTWLQEKITAEFAREVIGEGQLFFYYKRIGAVKILGGTVTENKKYDYSIYDYVYTYDPWQTISLGNYVWPLPQSETNLRVSSGE